MEPLRTPEDKEAKEKAEKEAKEKAEKEAKEKKISEAKEFLRSDKDAKAPLPEQGFEGKKVTYAGDKGYSEDWLKEGF